MSSVDKMMDSLKATFPTIIHTWQVVENENVRIIDYKDSVIDESFIVQYDENNIPFIKHENAKITISVEDAISKTFQISNIKKIVFIPNDKKDKNSIATHGDSRCDFVFFDEHDFCFVELKMNARSPRNAPTRRRKSLEQLIETIKLFVKKLKDDFSYWNKEAYICFPQELYALAQKKPKIDSSEMELRVALTEMGVVLKLDNHKICK